MGSFVLGTCALLAYVGFTAATLAAGEWQEWASATCWMVGTIAALIGAAWAIEGAVNAFKRLRGVRAVRRRIAPH
jgi:hypothetical protein